MNALPSAAALDWLGTVLRERLGVDIVLTRDARGHVALRVSGADGALRFDAPDARFGGDGRDLPCSWWDPRVAGLRSLLGSAVPLPGDQPSGGPLLHREGADVYVHHDLPGMLIWALARREEVGRADLDTHGRFPSGASHAGRHGYLDRPFVDEWIDVIAQLLQSIAPRLSLRTSTFALAPSHDVDLPSRYAMRPFRGFARAVLDDLRDLRPARALGGVARRLSPVQALGARDPANTFDWLMDRSERAGVRSAFYFICGRTNARMDAGYDIGQPAMRTLLRRIHARGHEIGLHPSFETYLDPATLGREADRLRAVCAEEGIRQEHWGGRMHYLRWQTPATLRAWEAAGMRYDSTLGYADRAGFRCGTCHEYPAFDPVAERAVRTRIRPLVAMEVSVMYPSYMGLGTGERAFEVFRMLKERCRLVGGSFTLLWHNSELTQAAERNLYERVVAA